MNPRYVAGRIARHFMPEWMVRFLLRRSIIIRAGLETSDPDAAVRRYDEALTLLGKSLAGATVLVFGYGGRFDVAIGLLQKGASHVVLCDRYAPPDDAHNRSLLARFSTYLEQSDGQVRPRSEWISLFQGDIISAGTVDTLPACDVVVSNSVLEHVEDVGAVLTALSRFTKRDGLHIHYIDLRDHFFRYPFEMLHYSERVWRQWLNPSSNLNRLRVWEYQDAFEKVFEEVAIAVIQRDDLAFARAQHRIRPEFQAREPNENAVTLIKAVAHRPRDGALSQHAA